MANPELTKSSMEAKIFGSGMEPGWPPWRRNLNLTIPDLSASTSTGLVSNSWTTISMGRVGSLNVDGVVSPFFVIGKISSNFFLLGVFDLRSLRFKLGRCSDGVSGVSSKSSSLSYWVPIAFCLFRMNIYVLKVRYVFILTRAWEK